MRSLALHARIAIAVAISGWCLGASAQSGDDSDLWELNPKAAEWNWAAGSNQSTLTFSATWGKLDEPSTANNPGPRLNAATWTDLEGNLWLFGGYAVNVNGTGINAAYNDLWKFTPKPVNWKAGK